MPLDVVSVPLKGYDDAGEAIIIDTPLGVEPTSCRCVSRPMPFLRPAVLLPWLLSHKVFEVKPEAIKDYWDHMRSTGSPIAQMSPEGDHLPLYVWGDGAQYTESGESMLVFTFGLVGFKTPLNNFPIFMCREANWN